MADSDSTPYPLHYWATRPFVRTFWGQLESRHRARTLTTALSNQFAMSSITPWLEANNWGTMKKPGRLEVLSQETQGLLSFGEWAVRGQRIYSFAPSLVAALQNSDCLDMRISDVVPGGSHTQYLHFGTTGIFLDPSVELEGAYVIRHEPFALRVVLCGRSRPQLSALTRWRERYDLRILEDWLEMPADVAIKRSLEHDLQDLDRAAKASDNRYGALDSIAVLKARMTEGFAAFEKALSLVLNSMAYLQAYPADAAKDWGKAPERLVHQVEHGAEKEQERARSKLWNLGHVPVTVVGGEFEREVGYSRGQVSAHLRRGHWRNQPHGPAMALRKLIWIRPMWVGADGR